MKKRLALLLVALGLGAALHGFGPSASLAKAPLPEAPIDDPRFATLSPLLAGQQGVVAVHFWATWCPTCVAEFAEMHKLGAVPGVQLVMVQTDADKTKAEQLKKSFFSGREGDVRWVSEGAAYFKPFEAGGLPQTVLFGPGGKVLNSTQGPLAWAEVLKSIVK